MNLTEDCETSLQVLRGFETDITTEVNDIKAKHLNYSSGVTKRSIYDLYGYIQFSCEDFI
jgi:hypothetical protein